MIQVPRPGRPIRLIALVYGGALFVWLAVEDVSVWPVTLFGWGLAALISFLITLDKLHGRTLSGAAIPLLAVCLGVMTGLGGSVATAGLMFFKNARHAHVFPDYPAGMLLATLERAPVWAAAGGLIGLSLGLGCLALYEKAG